MYILVIGCGQIGYHLAKALMVSGHEVLVIERDPSRVAPLVEQMGSVALIGDGCEAGVLQEAGASRADILIATTGNDADNLVACQVAKHRFHVPRTVAVVNNPNNQPLFSQLGVDVPISSTEIIMKHIEEELPTHPLVHVLNLEKAQREVVVIRIAPDSAVVGRPLGEVPLPPTSRVSLIIRRGGASQQPSDEVVLQGDDELICITTPDEEDSLLKVFTEVA